MRLLLASLLLLTFLHLELLLVDIADIHVADELSI